eukprot:513319-Pelagomonas_calceolata.AAC.1
MISADRLLQPLLFQCKNSCGIFLHHKKGLNRGQLPPGYACTYFELPNLTVLDKVCPKDK